MVTRMSKYLVQVSNGSNNVTTIITIATTAIKVATSTSSDANHLIGSINLWLPLPCLYPFLLHGQGTINLSEDLGTVVKIINC